MLDLTYFVTVAREGGVTRASEKLNRVQSNVTTRVRKLEDQLGVPLFLREGRRMILTADGHRLMDYADRLLALSEEAETAIRSATPGGRFRLGAMESTASVRLPSVLDKLTRAHPDIALELTTGNPEVLAAAVLDGDLDAAFAAGPPGDERLDSIPVYEEPVTVISASPALTGTEALLVLERGCPHRAQLEAWCAATGHRATRVIELGSFHAIFGCVLAGMGAALVPEIVLRTFPSPERLSRHTLPEGWNALTTHLLWRRNAISANTRALIEALDL